MTGIEPVYAAWKAAVLPLNYIREPTFAKHMLDILEGKKFNGLRIMNSSGETGRTGPEHVRKQIDPFGRIKSFDQVCSYLSCRSSRLAKSMF
jgi:hypothetical protein